MAVGEAFSTITPLVCVCVQAKESMQGAGIYIVSGISYVWQVDSASAMVNAARSLMSSVVLVVKTCYLASTAIARAEGTVPVSLSL